MHSDHPKDTALGGCAHTAWSSALRSQSLGAAAAAASLLASWAEPRAVTRSWGAAPGVAVESSSESFAWCGQRSTSHPWRTTQPATQVGAPLQALRARWLGEGTSRLGGMQGRPE
jgi:hypothetical protein